MIFDTHAHYNDAAFEEDREEILSGLQSQGIGLIVNACAAMNEIEDILALTKQYSFLYGAIGVHPSDVYDLTEEDLLKMEAALSQPKIVAVGEIGLDYHYEDTIREKQQEWFIRQIHLAKKVKKPIIVHSRDAAKDTVDILKAENACENGGVIHCFSYEKEIARIALDMGFYIGVGGVLTYKNGRKLQEVALAAPMDRILLETDCPYLSPVPFRGKRNDSGKLVYVVQKLAELKNIKEEEVIRMTEENARRFYNITENNE